MTTPMAWLVAVAMPTESETASAKRFVVVATDPERAKALMYRHGLAGGAAKVLVFGRAPPTLVTFLQAEPGAVYRMTLEVAQEF